MKQSQHSRNRLSAAFDKGLASWWTSIQGDNPHYCVSAQQAAAGGYGYFVRETEGGLEWQELTAHQPVTRLLPDLNYQHYRTQRARHERVARACGCTRVDGLEVCDATAGLGRDGLILAACGARVTLVERNPLMVLLLSRLLSRLDSQVTLVAADSCQWLAQRRYDVVYLDPMFPARSKSAAIRKEMALLQQLELPADSTETESLLGAAMEASRYRTVVKRPLKAESVGSAPVSGSISGKTVRFDFYSKRSLSEISPPGAA